jgi:PAS domain S-box-containing protein
LDTSAKTNEQLSAEVAQLRSELETSRRIAEIFLTADDEGMYAEVLGVILETTQSEYGVFGYINDDGDLVCPSLTRNIWDECLVPDKDIVFPHHTWSGIWGKSMREKKTLLSNEAFSIPQGHLSVTRALNTPIVHRGQLIGNLLVGNKPADYNDSDVRMLKTIAEHIAPVLKARLQRNVQQLQRNKAETQLERIHAAVQAGIILQSADGSILHANRIACEIFDMTPEDIQGKTSRSTEWQMVTEDGSPVPGDEHPSMITIRKGKPIRNAVRGLFADDKEKIRWLLINTEPISDPKTGELKEVLITFTDITDHKKTEQALRQSEAFIKAVLDNLPIGIAVNSVDPAVKFEYMNDKFPEFYRTTRETLADPDAFWNAVYEDPEFREEMKNRVIDDCASGDPERMYWVDVPLTRKGRKTTYITARNIPVPDKNMAISVVWDVTHRKLAEEERSTLEAQIQHAQKLESLGVLAGGIAHDFNNLLMAILGNVDLAMMDLSQASPVQQNLTEIKNASVRAADLAKQMLAYSGKGRFVVTAMDLSEAVEEMGHMLDVSISKKAVLKYNLSQNLPPMEADATQIRQIIMNLITNASEAIGDRSGLISITTNTIQADRRYLRETYLDEDLAPGLYVTLEVADTGCGMDSETQAKFFDPFFTTKFTGRGLGMAAVLGIVRSHEGAINVYSEPGKGTTMKVLFPAASDGTQTLSTSQIESDEKWKGSGSVLLVDDEETVRRIGTMMIKRLGMTIITSVDGREAIDIYRREGDKIDCVILDLTMPHMDGEETFRQLRRINPDVRVIMSSGYSEQEVTQRFRGKGISGFIQKPYELQKLSDTLRQTLGE